mmetsp:Transcript_15617/g.41948  ORF Transcript_15617/g.41948 Transcript_15617/m.41948 type:complete len:222 (-) Transcript_15617:792-1457(-)
MPHRLILRSATSSALCETTTHPRFSAHQSPSSWSSSSSPWQCSQASASHSSPSASPRLTCCRTTRTSRTRCAWRRKASAGASRSRPSWSPMRTSHASAPSTTSMRPLRLSRTSTWTSSPSRLACLGAGWTSTRITSRPCPRPPRTTTFSSSATSSTRTATWACARTSTAQTPAASSSSQAGPTSASLLALETPLKPSFSAISSRRSSRRRASRMHSLTTRT